MKFFYPYDGPERALRVIEELRGPEPPYPHNIPRRAWLRKMLWMRERRLPYLEQLDALEGRIKAHLVAERLKK